MGFLRSDGAFLLSFFYVNLACVCVCAELPQQPVGSAIDVLMSF